MTTLQSVLRRAENDVHQHISEMGRLVLCALGEAMKSLNQQDAGIAEQIINEDLKLNELQLAVEQECLKILAMHEPKATDLREVVASLQIATELERMGDHAKDIAKIVLGMDSSDFSGPLDMLGKMAELCNQMLSDALQSYINLDGKLAQATAACDAQLDDMDEQTRANLLMTLMTSIDQSMHTTHLLWIAYHLERFGDRATNITERVVFIVGEQQIKAAKS